MNAALRSAAKWATFVAFLAMIAGCNLLPVRTVHDECAIDRPIRLTKAEFLALSDESAKQIRQHNETGAKVCNWKNEPNKTK